MYKSFECLEVFLNCNNATELITCREILELSGVSMGAIVARCYDFLMYNFLISDKI